MFSLLLLAAVLGQAPVGDDEGRTPTPSEPPPPRVAAAPVPEAFFLEVLSWDAEAGQALQGRARTPLTPGAFFSLVERPDLLERSRQASLRRLLFGISSGAALALGLVTAVVLFAGTPDMNSRFCVEDVTVFNEVCEPKYRFHQTAGAATLATGLVASALLATLAYWSDPQLDPDEGGQLVSRYNAALMRRLRGAPTGWRWLPVVTPDGARLALSLRF